MHALYRVIMFFLIASSAVSKAHFGQGSGPIVMDNVDCTGNEQSLIDCTHTTDHNCHHFEDAGVVCSTPCEHDGQLALFDGWTNMEGRIEICKNGVWGTVCDNEFDQVDASVICKQLGFPHEGACIQ